MGDPLYGIPGTTEEATTNNEIIIDELNEASHQIALENERIMPQRVKRRTRRAKYFQCGRCRYTMESKYFSKTQQRIFKFSKRTPFVRCKECLEN